MSYAPRKSKLAIMSIPEEVEEYEEDDNFDEMTALVPQGTMTRNTKPYSSVDAEVYHDALETFSHETSGTKSKSITASRVFKDNPKAPQGSVLQSAFFRDIPKTDRQKSTMPSIMFKDHPKTHRAKSTMPSRMFKDHPEADRAKTIGLSAQVIDNAKTSQVKSARSPITFTPKDFKSFMNSKVDKVMSQRQTSFATLPPTEKTKQIEWATKKIEEMAPCPDQYAWRRVDQDGWGGYVCIAGTHAMLDQQLAEGKGAIIVLAKRDILGGKGAERCGPWYPHPNIANCYIFQPGTEITGVKVYDQPSFFGSDHQIARARWEYYSWNPDRDLMDRMGYEFPEREPPKEWELEKNIPKSKDVAMVSRAN